MRFFMASLTFFGTTTLSVGNGSCNASVTFTGYVIAIMPKSLGFPTSGYANGTEACCYGKVDSLPSPRIQKACRLCQPAAGRGKNSMCPLEAVDGTPACTKSPRMNKI